MTKAELIVDIVKLNVMVGITDKEEFVNYLTKVLPKMTIFELYRELEHTEDNTIGLME